MLTCQLIRGVARALWFPTFLGLLAGWASPGHAGLVLEVHASSGRPGQVGDLYVTLANVADGSGATYQVNAFEFDISLGRQAGIRFLGADRATNLGGFSYIFQVPGPGDLSSSPLPGPDLLGSDSAINTISNGTVLGVGGVVGLGNITYQVDLGVTIGTRFDVAFNPEFTDLSDTNGDLLPILTRVGTISTGFVVPDPPSLVLSLTGMATLGAVRRRNASAVRFPGK